MNKSSRGFTLIEVIIAAVILSFFTASFTLLVRSTMFHVSRSSDVTSALFDAKSVMENLRALPADELFAYNGNPSIEVQPVGNKLIKITVRNGIELVTLRRR